ncbi:MAG: hypothetical protein A3B16_01280 [Candidatus Zambryskibacteria bacterium RIFCSPLOWO2_01_FULL_45_43]|uniref:Isoleucine--tRNA ligase n=1 Tax=Candidatus Zambryskibacteria bacterium RIFCSPLOWO2_01_FULL_45_43 TaxID=1802762 RepID=A0A1G2U5P6_9BACT|nr:MAG: hypothetical protein A3B16_01280 [Candidatus Zambryskibacteria bacterium RIFCSPLOWO2_01_FULL_45_43]
MLRGLKEFNLSDIEEKVLKFWKENHVFERSLKLREDSEPFRFFEGPPTANGRPHMGHAQGRVFKDIIPRFKTMQGYYVERKAGWDTHGLPVEIEVEKELGLKNKQDIEKFGIAEFNQRAKASVWKYKEEWEKMTDRIGFWVDLEHPYITYDSKYIESLWWVFKEISKRKLLKKSFKIVPWCPRCQTPLSSHELSQGYKKAKDPSIYVKFKIKQKTTNNKQQEFLLVWTTTPWTLPSNVAIAVNPKLIYTKYKIGNEYVWAHRLPSGIEDAEVVEKISGKRLVGTAYEPLFSVSGPWQSNKKFFKVYAGDFVSTKDGSGFVHIAPAFGEDDLNLVKKLIKDLVGNIPITIDERGIVKKGLPGTGKFAKTADKDIIADLEERKLLLQTGSVEHDYPFCWRCDTPLLYFARYSWFIEMSRLKNDLLKNNQKINWIPAHIKEGRFGEWLKDIKDWAISRDRYWGTPLPIWQCGHCQALEVIGSLEELNKLRYYKNNFWILRHGEADHNAQGWVPGIEKDKIVSHLTEKGKAQVKESALKLKKLLRGKKLDFIFTSPYERTRDSAKIVAEAVGGAVITTEDFHEYDTGIFFGKPISEFWKFFKDSLEKFTKAPPNGETLNAIKQRMIRGVLALNQKHQDKNILIVSHGDPLWVLEGALKNLNNEEIVAAKSDYIRVGEVRELPVGNWPYNPTTGEVDMHRPHADEIYLKCRKCQNRMARVPEVADAWFDSGAMPYAQWHYPFEHKDLVDKKIAFPADYISEGIDQTRGWFYTLLAVATALGKGVPYLNVITQGHILDKFGKKMSKSKGNVVSPMDLMDKYGADALRWYFYTQTVSGEPKAFDEADVVKSMRKFLMILYNSFLFFDTYGIRNLLPLSKDDFNIIDWWILTRLSETIGSVTGFLENYDVGSASRAIEELVDDLSRWHIRRSRRRFQKSNNPKDLATASSVLHHVLLEISKLTAPFTPFFSDALYQSLIGENQSVHLTDWPKFSKEYLKKDLIEKMSEVRRLASLALAVRAEKGFKVRQPLQLLEIKSKVLDVRDTEFLDLLKDEVNVKEVAMNLNLDVEVLFDTVITPELKSEGLVREFARMVQDLRQAAGLEPKDRIMVMAEIAGEVRRVLENQAAVIKKEVNAETLELKKSEKFDAEINGRIDGQPIWIGVRKIK